LGHANKIKTQQILGTVPLMSTMQQSETSITTCYRRLHAKSCELFLCNKWDAYKIAKIKFSFQQWIKQIFNFSLNYFLYQTGKRYTKVLPLLY